MGRALANISRIRFQVGEFDPPEQVPYTKIKSAVIQCRKYLGLIVAIINANGAPGTSLTQSAAVPPTLPPNPRCAAARQRHHTIR